MTDILSKVKAMQDANINLSKIQADQAREIEKLQAEIELLKNPVKREPRFFFTTEEQIKMARCGHHGEMYYEQGKNMIAFIEVPKP